jgi:hypothetical protein
MLFFEMESTSFFEPEDELLAHLLDDIIYLSEAHRNDSFFQALLWPKVLTNALHIKSIQKSNANLLHSYNKGIKISSSYILIFTLIQSAALLCIILPIFELLQLVVFLRFNELAEFIMRILNPFTMTFIILTICLFFLYSSHYTSSIRLTPTFFEYVQQRKDLREFKLGEELRLLQESVRLNEGKQQMLLDVIAQAYNTMIAIQANRPSYGKQGKELLEKMASLIPNLGSSNSLSEDTVDKEKDYDQRPDILDNPFE